MEMCNINTFLDECDGLQMEMCNMNTFLDECDRFQKEMDKQ